MSEVTIAGNLIAMFAALTPANDLEFRYGTNAPTVRVEGLHRCAAADARPRDRDRLAGGGARRRRAALKTFRGTDARQWIKGQSSPVSEADIAVDALLRERLGCAAPAYGWLSEETEDDPARLDATRCGSSIRSTAPAPISPAGGLVVSVALARAAGPCWPPSSRRRPTNCSWRSTASGATLQRHADRRRARETARRRQGRRPQAPPRSLCGIHPQVVLLPRIGSLALRLARVAHGAVDIAFAGGNSHDWDLAAADLLVHEAGGLLTDLDGAIVDLQSPRSGAWRADRGRALAPRQVLLHLIRDRIAEFA